MHYYETSMGEGPDDARKMRDFLGPSAVAKTIDQAITICWMMLPEERRTISAVEAEIRRTVERSLANLKEDASAFGASDD